MVDGQREQVGKPTEEDLKHWGHHTSIHTVPDTIMQEAAGDDVSFVFSCKVDGKEELLMEEEPPRGAAIASTSGRQAVAPAGDVCTTNWWCICVMCNLPGHGAKNRLMVSTCCVVLGTSHSNALQTICHMKAAHVAY